MRLDGLATGASWILSWILWCDSHRSNRSIRGMSRSFSSSSLHAISHMLVCCLGRAGTHMSPVAVLEDFDVRAVLDFTAWADCSTCHRPGHWRSFSWCPILLPGHDTISACWLKPGVREDYNIAIKIGLFFTVKWDSLVRFDGFWLLLHFITKLWSRRDCKTLRVCAVCVRHQCSEQKPRRSSV